MRKRGMGWNRQHFSACNEFNSLQEVRPQVSHLALLLQPLDPSLEHALRARVARLLEAGLQRRCSGTGGLEEHLDCLRVPGLLPPASASHRWMAVLVHIPRVEAVVDEQLRYLRAALKPRLPSEEVREATGDVCVRFDASGSTTGRAHSVHWRVAILFRDSGISLAPEQVLNSFGFTSEDGVHQRRLPAWAGRSVERLWVGRELLLDRLHRVLGDRVIYISVDRAQRDDQQRRAEQHQSRDEVRECCERELRTGGGTRHSGARTFTA